MTLLFVLCEKSELKREIQLEFLYFLGWQPGSPVNFTCRAHDVPWHMSNNRKRRSKANKSYHQCWLADFFFNRIKELSVCFQGTNIITLRKIDGSIHLSRVK